MIWRSEKYLAPARIQTPAHPVHSIGTMLTTLVWLYSHIRLGRTYATEIETKVERPHCVISKLKIQKGMFPKNFDKMKDISSRFGISQI
jgi:hypothetical protein